MLEDGKKIFSEFSEGLFLHIGWEENQLFPMFELHTGMIDTGTAAVMRKEHRIIEVLLREVGENLEISAPELVDNCRELSGMLKQHK